MKSKKEWQEIAKKNRINRSAFNVRVHRGFSLEDAATIPLGKVGRKRLTFTKEDKNTRAYACKFAREVGVSIDDAIKIILSKRKAQKTKDVYRKTAAENGISHSTFLNRLARGWSIEMASTQPLGKKK